MPLKMTLRYLILFTLSVLLLSCRKDNESPLSTGTAEWKDVPVVSSQSGNTVIQIQGVQGIKWNARITEGAAWCSFSLANSIPEKDGVLTEGINALYVYFSENTDKEDRKAGISIQIGEGTPISLVLTQNGKISGTDAETDAKRPNKAWAEIPDYQANPAFRYVTHYTHLNGKSVRNYSICYDQSHKAALWVAYPLHKCYLGNLDRTDEWTYDPDIESLYQIYVKRAYKEHPKYDRGHQIPSADRTQTREMNAQTFYFTNQTPQVGKGLNQDIWQKLEEVIRKNYICADTLYVVTGAYFAHSNVKATDNNGVKADVPTHYFKVLLRTKSGMTGKWVRQCDASQLQAIGFWLENKAYSSTQITKDICKKVSEIEAITGFTFFPGIPSQVKNDFNAIEWNLY